MCFFVKISRSGLTFLVSWLFGIADVFLFRERGNFRDFVALPAKVLLEEVFVGLTEAISGVAAAFPVVDEDDFRAFFGSTEGISEPAVESNCSGAGCGCADRWDCPLWCWLAWL